MRRKDREITDIHEIKSIINDCKVIRLAIQSEDVPYIVPLNFGFSEDDGRFTFYCHSAREGRKLDLLRRDPRVGFEMDCRGRLDAADHPCGYGYFYASIIGTGTVYFPEGEEKLAALSALMHHMAGREDVFTEDQAKSVTVLAIRVESLSAKSKKMI